MNKYKRVYTGKFKVGDRVYLNDKRSTMHGHLGTVLSVNKSLKANPYEMLIDGDEPYSFFYNETELSETPVE